MGLDFIQPPAVPRAALRLRKRLLFGLLVAVGLYGMTELTSFFALWALDHRPFSFRRAAEERAMSQAAAGVTTAQATPQFDHMFVLHPYLGLVLKQGWGGRINQKSPISAYGFCDPNPPAHRRAPDQVIVGIAGGSVASNFFDDGAPALERELKRDSRYAGKKFEFVNLAVYGFKQPQQVMALNYALAMGGAFDLVVNIDGFNEIALYPFENAPVEAYPLYPVGWHRHHGEVMDLRTCVYAGRIYHLLKSRAHWARRFSRLPLRYSLTAALVWKLRDRRLEGRVGRQTDGLRTHRNSNLPAWATGPRRHFPTPQAMFEELADTWARCSLQLDRVCKGHGIRYYHFLQPNQYVPGSKPIGPDERRYAYLETHPLAGNVVQGYPYLRGRGADLLRRGVHFHDLTLAFAGTPEPLYSDNCCHYNLHGHEILADHIARAILETPEPPGDTPTSANGLAPH